MCGLAGFILPEDKLRADVRLRCMTNSLSHRGPDGEGQVVLPTGEPGWVVGLGHRRLAILDLSTAGQQPMATDDKTYWIVFNGEIYNFWALRQGLAAQGEVFRSRCDTEVLLRLLMLQGENAPQMQRHVGLCFLGRETTPPTPGT